MGERVYKRITENAKENTTIYKGFFESYASRKPDIAASGK